MSDQTKIEWADSTFNSWIGCTKVSPACDHCYAAVSTPARAMKIEWGAGKPRHRTAASTWKLPERWNRNPFYECYACDWRGDNLSEHRNGGCATTYGLDSARRRVFSASLADWLDNEVPMEWLVDFLDLICRTPNLDWLQLSKRIGNFTPRLKASAEFVRGVIGAQAERSAGLPACRSGRTGDRLGGAYLEGEEAYRRSLVGWNEDHSLQASAGGVRTEGRLLAGPRDDRREAALRSGGAAGVASLSRADSAGDDDQSQRRDEAQQPAEQSGIGDLQRATTPRDQCVGSTAPRRTRLEASENAPDRSGREGDARSPRGRHDGQDTRRAIRSDTEGRVRNLSRSDLEALLAWIDGWIAGTPPANVWIGATVINQAEADRDVPKLLRVPAHIRFLSIEPMLGPVDLSVPLNVCQFDEGSAWSSRNLRSHDTGLHWVIVGGESGNGARPAHLTWIRSLVDQCRAAEVACHVKQLGSVVLGDGISGPGQHWPVGIQREELVRRTEADQPFAFQLLHRKGGDMAEWPEDLRMRDFP